MILIKCILRAWGKWAFCYCRTQCSVCLLGALGLKYSVGPMLSYWFSFWMMYSLLRVGYGILHYYIFDIKVLTARLSGSLIEKTWGIMVAPDTWLPQSLPFLVIVSCFQMSPVHWPFYPLFLCSYSSYFAPLCCYRFHTGLFEIMLIYFSPWRQLHNCCIGGSQKVAISLWYHSLHW